MTALGPQFHRRPREAKAEQVATEVFNHWESNAQGFKTDGVRCNIVSGLMNSRGIYIARCSDGAAQPRLAGQYLHWTTCLKDLLGFPHRV